MRNLSDKIIITFTTLAISMGPVQFCFASGGEHHGAPLQTYWTNFLIFSLVMFLVTRKTFKQVWSIRRSSLLDAVQKQGDALKEAEALLTEAKRRSAAVQKEIEGIWSSIKSSSEAESKQIVHEAKLSAERVKRQSRETIALEEKAAIAATRRAIVEEALKSAEKKVSSSLTSDKDKALRTKAADGARILYQ